MPIGNPAAREIVGRNLHRHTISFEDTDTKAAQLPRDRGEHFGAVIERHAKRGTREHLSDRSFELDQIFFCDIASTESASLTDAALEINLSSADRLDEPEKRSSPPEHNVTGTSDRKAVCTRVYFALSIPFRSSGFHGVVCDLVASRTAFTCSAVTADAPFPQLDRS